MKYLTFVIVISLLFFAGCSNTAISVWDGVLRNETGTPVTQTNNALDVAIQDQFTESITLFLTENIANITLNNNYSIDDEVLSINSPIAPVVGNYLCLKENTAFFQSRINAVTPLGGNNYQITVSDPLDYPFTTNGACSIRNTNMAVNGAVTPRIFEISPSNLIDDWDIVSITYHMEDNVAMDSAKFGGIPALTKGVVLRIEDGYTKNIANFRTNGDFIHNGYSIAYDDRAPAGIYAVRGIKNYREINGVVFRLENETKDRLVVIIQDDLTGLNELHFKGIGHRVNE